VAAASPVRIQSAKATSTTHQSLTDIDMAPRGLFGTQKTNNRLIVFSLTAADKENPQSQAFRAIVRC
jgi:hypothetical protein